MSFACPHFEPDTDSWLRLRWECVPGRPGCAIAKTTGFAVPWEELLNEKQESKRQQRLATLVDQPTRLPPPGLIPSRVQTHQNPGLFRCRM